MSLELLTETGTATPLINIEANPLIVFSIACYCET
jgi:hypothetical protein